MTFKDRITDFRRVRAGDLLPNEKNWRLHSDSQREALSAALERIGYAGALIGRDTPEGTQLLDGHLRRDLDPEQQVPVLIVDLDDEEADLLLATYDPIGAMAEADQTRLDNLIAGMDEQGRELVSFLARRAPDVVEVPVPEPPQEPRTRSGDLWLLGEHRLLCGDATKPGDVARLRGGARVDAVFTSPPYAVGVDYGEAYTDDLQHLRPLLRASALLWLDAVVTGGFAVVNFGDAARSSVADIGEVCEYPMALEHWPAFREAGWVLWSRRVWCKPTPRVNSPWTIASNRAATDWEHVWTWKAPGDPVQARVDGRAWSVKGWFDTTSEQGVDVGKDIHGAGMAVSAAARMIEVHVRPAASVMDPFLGSGTTLIAAEQLGRRCFALEIEPRYVDVSIARWEAFTGQTAVLDSPADPS